MDAWQWVPQRKSFIQHSWWELRAQWGGGPGPADGWKSCKSLWGVVWLRLELADHFWGVLSYVQQHSGWAAFLIVKKINKQSNSHLPHLWFSTLHFPKENITLLACSWLFFKTTFVTLELKKGKKRFRKPAKWLKDSSAVGKGKEDLTANAVMVGEMKGWLPPKKKKKRLQLSPLQGGFHSHRAGKENIVHFLMASGDKCHLASLRWFSTAEAQLVQGNSDSC